jgi:hypothetical protein
MVYKNKTHICVFARDDCVRHCLRQYDFLQIDRKKLTTQENTRSKKDVVTNCLHS